MPVSPLINVEKMPANPALPDRLGAMFWHFLRQTPLLFVLLVTLSAILAVLGALIPWFLGQFVDVLTLHSTEPQKAWDDLLPLFIWFSALCLLLSAILGVAFEYLNHVSYMPSFANMIRRQVHWYTLRQSLAFFQDDFAGRIANKVQQLGPSVRDVTSRCIGAIGYVIVFAISSLALIGSANVWLILPMLAWIGFYILILGHFIPRVRKRSLDVSNSFSLLVGRIVDSYTNILTVKLFARKEHEDDFVLESLRTHTARGRTKGFVVVGMNAALSVCNSTMIGLITLGSLWLWREGLLSTGDVAMILPLAVQINHQMHWIMWEATGISEWLGTAEESMETLSRPHRVVDRPHARPIKITEGAIRFEGVSFHYGQDVCVLENLNLSIPAGQKVGLVGHSGAGKSTLVSLLLRFHDIEKGKILIDDQDIAGLTQDSLREKIAMVTQDTSLLHRSIADNIGYGSPCAERDAIMDAARRAGAHEFITDLEDSSGRKGYDAHVGERGVKLSGGQRQRIAIARIILKNAPILILDEATSALDSEIETYIQQQLAPLMEGKTVLAIAHRLSTIARMDRLIVMDHGQIVEDGFHADLIRKGGHYARLWRIQSGGFVTG